MAFAAPSVSQQEGHLDANSTHFASANRIYHADISAHEIIICERPTERKDTAEQAVRGRVQKKKWDNVVCT